MVWVILNLTFENNKIKEILITLTFFNYCKIIFLVGYHNHLKLKYFIKLTVIVIIRSDFLTQIIWYMLKIESILVRII